MDLRGIGLLRTSRPPSVDRHLAGGAQRLAARRRDTGEHRCIRSPPPSAVTLSLACGDGAHDQPLRTRGCAWGAAFCRHNASRRGGMQKPRPHCRGKRDQCKRVISGASRRHRHDGARTRLGGASAPPVMAIPAHRRSRAAPPARPPRGRFRRPGRRCRFSPAPACPA
jgi:hypothetical protein